MTKKRVRIEFPKPDYCWYLPGEQLSHTSYRTEGGCVTKVLAPDEEPDEQVKSLIDRLQGVEGVQSTEVRPYNVIMQKAPTSDWKDIHPPVIDVLKSHLGWGGAKVKLTEKKPSKHPFS